MIPASQRPDGTWRKARKIRTAGPTRYVPPALRKPDGGGKEGLADDLARSLGDVAAVGRRGASRFLDAALFLLTTTAVSSTATTTKTSTASIEKSTDINENPTAVIDTSTGVSGTSTASPEISTATIETATAANVGRSEGQGQEDREGRRPRGVHGSNDEPPALPQRLVHSVARAAKEQLGCDECRPLSREPAAYGTDPNEEENYINDGSRGSSSRNAGNRGRDAWWAKLRLAEAGWSEEIEGGCGSAAVERGKGDAWVGLELSLRPCDVGYADGQTAIVEFLKGRVGERWADEGVVGGLPVEAQKETHQGEEEELAVGMVAKAKTAGSVAVVEAARGMGGGPCSSPDGGDGGSGGGGSGGSGRKGEGCDGIDEVETSNGNGAHAEGLRRGRGGNATETTTITTRKVMVAVLVFGSELSKRDRAELHGQAEKAGGVASSSLGVGPARFLTLTCGLGGIGAAIELKLSAEKADLARSLFRLAQQQYHSRYECLSHREIREIVALGGPNAKDHPDLFKLIQEHRQNNFDPAKSNRTDAKGGAGQSGTPEEGLDDKGGERRRQAAAEESPPVIGEEQEGMSDQGAEAEPIAVEKCPW